MTIATKLAAPLVICISGLIGVAAPANASSLLFSTGDPDGKMASANFRVVSGAGHMGPISHPEIVAEAIAGHVLECDTHREAGIDNHATKTA